MKSSMKIGDVATTLNTTPRTLRYYEEEGLVDSCRTPKGTRYYSEADIARFKAILKLADAGLSISLIKELAMALEQHKTGDSSSREVISITQKFLTQVDEQMQKLEALKKDILFASKKVKTCFNCQNPATSKGCPNCKVPKNLRKSELLNLIWEQSGCK